MKNRIIKYRQPIWGDGKFKEWHYWGFGIEQGGEIADVYPLNFKLGVCDPKESLQFTGLKDKNGVEIYEGDIVKWINGTTRDNPEKIWVPNLKVILVEIYPGFSSSIMSLSSGNNIEVMGNIHTNPEFLYK